MKINKFGDFRAYVLDQLIEKRKSRAFSEVNLVSNTSFLNYRETLLVVFLGDVQGQNL